MKFGKPICTVALAAMALSTACSTSNNDLETIPVATLVGRYAVNVGAGVSEIVAYHTESRSVFITVDSSTTPSSFQRISLRGLTTLPSGSGIANPVTASNLESGVVVSVATTRQWHQLHGWRRSDPGHQRQLACHCRAVQSQNLQRCGGLLSS